VECNHCFAVEHAPSVGKGWCVGTGRGEVGGSALGRGMMVGRCSLMEARRSPGWAAEGSRAGGGWWGLGAFGWRGVMRSREGPRGEAWDHL
jgi:hypothetical protein